MNPPTLPVKRRPVAKGFFKRLHAVTGHRNQRVAAAATAEDIDCQDHSRGFTIIVIIHIVAIALYFIHLNFLNKHTVEPTAKAATTTTTAPKEKSAPAIVRIENPPMLEAHDVKCMVAAGDNYARIAAREGVDENALRAINNNATIRAGMTLKIPPKRIVAVEPPEVAAIRNQVQSTADRGLVEPANMDISSPPRALLVRPKAGRDTKPPKASPVTKERSYVVQSGDNVLRISKRFNVDQAALMRANGISNPRKLQTGMTLVIPH